MSLYNYAVGTLINTHFLHLQFDPQPQIELYLLRRGIVYVLNVSGHYF